MILFAVLLFGFDNSATIFAQPPANRRIELVIEVDARANVGTQQQWMQALTEVGADRLLVQTGSAKKPTIEESKLSSSTLITLTGIVDGRRLKLPGKTFAITDTGGIRDYIQNLRNDGAEVALADKKAFGLTAQQLVDLHGTLKKPLDFNTRGVGVGDVVTKISGEINQEFSLDATAKRMLSGRDVVAEELNGVSAGTALAAAIRPLGLVLQPRRPPGGTTELWIVDSQSAAENWPIGWPISRAPVQVEPKLFERLKLEIRGFALSDAMNAIESRTGVPFLYDHNAMAREGIDPSQTKVTLVRDKVAYLVAVGKLLGQTKPALVDELRIDENGKPFLWITVR